MSLRRWSTAPVTTRQIVRATIRCLARDGYSGLTMKKVAREAGVSQGILHYYFADKRAILVAALETVTADLDRRVAAAQARGPRTRAARLRALVEACLRLAVEEREFWVVFVEFWGEMMHDRPASRGQRRPLRTHPAPDRPAASRRGSRAGLFRPVDVPPRGRGRSSAWSTASRSSSPSIPKAFGVAEATRFCDDALVRYLARETP